MKGAMSTALIYIDFDTDTGNNTQVNFYFESESEAGARAEAKIEVGSEILSRTMGMEADPMRYKNYG